MPIFETGKEMGRGFVPVERVRSLLQNKAKESDIIDALAGEGYSVEEIDSALNEALSQPKPEQEEIKPPEPVEQHETEALFEKEIEEPKPTSAPLFVKLERYDKILTSLEELRDSFEVMKNALTALDEIDNLRGESVRIAQSALEAVDKRLILLDSEFLRPGGSQEEIPSLLPASNREGLNSELTGLKGQLEQLRGELKSLA